MTTVASQITSLTVVYTIGYSGADQRKHQSSASLAIVQGIHRRPVNSPHKWPVTRKMFPFHDVIMKTLWTLHSMEIVPCQQTAGSATEDQRISHQTSLRFSDQWRLSLSHICLTHWGREKIVAILPTIFQMHISCFMFHASYQINFGRENIFRFNKYNRKPNASDAYAWVNTE